MTKFHKFQLLHFEPSTKNFKMIPKTLEQFYENYIDGPIERNERAKYV